MSPMLFLALLDAGSATPTPDAGNATTQIIVAALGAGGVGAILAAIVTGLFSKKKLGAEATEIITKAAAGVVTNLQDENTRLAAANTKLVADHEARMSALMTSHQREIDDWKRVLQLHVAWDAIAIARLGELGVDLPEAPPLSPANRFDHPVD